MNEYLKREIENRYLFKNKENKNLDEFEKKLLASCQADVVYLDSSLMKKGVLGSYEAGKNNIKILKNQDTESRIKTLLHEITHQYEMLDINLKHDVIPNLNLDVYEEQTENSAQLKMFYIKKELEQKVDNIGQDLLSHAKEQKAEA